MDTNDYYALIGPCIVLLMVFEAQWARWRGHKVHHLPDTLANLATGMGQVLFGIFTGAFLLLLYDRFQATFGLVTWSKSSPIPWVLAFVGVDFCYYWFHRSSHAVAALWAVHVVHHQSNEMNLSVALRQTYFSDFTALLFFWPLPLIGVPREAFFLAVGVLSIYESLLHNQIIDRTGLWGILFNCPAFHRLHHACDERYLDKNFGSTLIVWDRIFGSFVKQTVPPTYGIVEPHVGHNPVWAQVEPIVALVRRVRMAPSWRDACAVLLRPPGWIAPWENPRELVVLPRPARLPVPTSIAAYAIGQALVTAVCAEFVLFLVWRGTPPGVVTPAVVLLIAGPVVFGGLLEQKAWTRLGEPVRLVVTASVFAMLFAHAYGSTAILLLVAWVVVSLIAFFTLVPRQTKETVRAEALP
ncbi:MAG TPA: sterol desaturase family protein [Polyangium sp.]|nr:sterol desaturase family protein [Polyangium sp.]